MSSLYDWYYQLFHKPALPDISFEGQTILITGTNTGVGKEAARHLVKLSAKRVIATARSITRGQSVVTDIEASTRDRPGVPELWELDYGSWDSVHAFAERLRTEFGGPDEARLDAACLNAGRATTKWGTMDDGHEECIMVNCLVTGFLMCVLVPILQAGGKKRINVNPGPEHSPVLRITGSGIASLASFKEKRQPSVFDALKDEKLAKYDGSASAT